MTTDCYWNSKTTVQKKWMPKMGTVSKMGSHTIFFSFSKWRVCLVSLYRKFGENFERRGEV